MSIARLRHIAPAVVLLAATVGCAPAAPPTPTKPAAPAATSAPAASPAAKPAASPAASPVASPVAIPAAAKPAATADPALASVWQGKTVNLIIGSEPGGGYDVWGRAVARHLNKHLPGNPVVVAQNMPGGVHRIATNHIQQARPDGLTIGLVDVNIPTNQLRGEGPNEGVRYDVNQLNWLGTASAGTLVLVSQARANVTASSLGALTATPLKLGLSTSGDPRHVAAAVLREGLGWKLESIFGYPGTAQIFLGMERGEVEATVNSWDSFTSTRADDITSKRWLPLVQIGLKGEDPLLDGVPLAQDLFTGKGAEAQQLLNLVDRPQQWARPFVAPPGVEPRTLAGLRAAFMATMADPEFLAEARGLRLDVRPLDGERIQALIKEFMETPKAAVDKLDAVIEADKPR